MDLGDYLNSTFNYLHKNKAATKIEPNNLNKRRTSFKEKRRNTRATLFLERRNVQEILNCTESVDKMDTNNEQTVPIQEPVRLGRLERLRRYKQQKLAKLKDKKSKPPFKVSYKNGEFLDISVANQFIKGKPINLPKFNIKPTHEAVKSTTNLTKPKPFVTMTRGSSKKQRTKQTQETNTAQPGRSDSPVALHSAQEFKIKLDDTIDRLKNHIDLWVSYKANQSLPDHAIGMIDAATGHSQLLINDKFQQFDDLITSYANKNSEKPILIEDLHGFWDMIYIQVENLEKQFENLEKSKENNWPEDQFLQEKREPAKKKTHVKKIAASSSSGLRMAIRNARLNKLEGSDEANKSKTTSSPGLTMMAVSLSAKKLKTDTPRAIVRKAEEVLPSDNKENNLFRGELFPEVLSRTPKSLGRKSSKKRRSALQEVNLNGINVLPNAKGHASVEDNNFERDYGRFEDFTPRRSARLAIKH